MISREARSYRSAFGESKLTLKPFLDALGPGIATQKAGAWQPAHAGS